MGKRRKSNRGPYLLHLELLRDRIEKSDRYPYNLPAIRHLSTLTFHPKVTFLVGENGSGKSTLLEAIAVASGLNPEGGSRNFNFATRASHSSLDECLRLARTIAVPGDSYFLRAESFYNVASEIERLDKESGGPPIIAAYGGVSLHEQSHGESFFALFRNRFRDNGLYLMDEPEAALSPQRQLQFLALLHDYIKRGGQFVIATHSPIIMAYPNARIYVLNTDGIREVAYTDTEHYQVTRGFLSNPRRSLDVLLADDDSSESLSGKAVSREGEAPAKP
jgi:predicted ATPase